ncbi:hypothetical protein [Pseudooctadecabacter sp.]|uniref:hypothetical protein n=1 Tax=Pseudooctadecabacter sp. TaxID=1966338 RepID=UPI0025E70926|nr:hypothetical protein [Pseudooctadecabacter sp.]
MAQLKKIGMAAGTFSVALGIGFVMQNGDALASRFGSEDVAGPAPFAATPDTPVSVIQASTGGEEAAIEPATLVTATPVTLAEPSADGLQFAANDRSVTAPSLDTPAPVSDVAVNLPDTARLPETPQAPVQMASIDAEAMPDIDVSSERETITVDADCVPTMMAAPAAAAMVDVALVAPCHIDTAFTVHHQGMMFTAMTDEDGTAKVTVPALAETAVVIVAFENGDGAVATAVVPEFASYDRAVLQWQGNADIMLSAYEDNANFGDPSHIYVDNPGDMARLEASEGGYLMRLGVVATDNPLMAEVYTFPTATASNPADVVLVAEAAITAENCGNELAAQSIQVSPDGETSALDLTMMMPDCDAVGDFLILQNMFEDLTLASR